MNEQYIRFYIVLKDRYLECLLDKRCSFKENLAILEELTEEKGLSAMKVYDPRKHLFLDVSCPVKEFGITTFMTFYLY